MYFSNTSFNKTLENTAVPARIRIKVQIKKWVPAGEIRWLKRKSRKQCRHGSHYPVRAGHPKPCTAAWAGFAARAHRWAALEKALSVPQLACTHHQELKPHADCSQAFMLMNVMHVRDFTAVSHHLAYIHVLLSTLEGKCFHSRKEKNIVFKTDHDAITLFYSVQLLVMKYDSPEAWL